MGEEPTGVGPRLRPRKVKSMETVHLNAEEKEGETETLLPIYCNPVSPLSRSIFTTFLFVLGSLQLTKLVHNFLTNFYFQLVHGGLLDCPLNQFEDCGQKLMPNKEELYRHLGKVHYE